MKTCPLCQRELVTTTADADWCCPTVAEPQLWTIPHSHYMIHNVSQNSDIPSERLFVENYQLVSSKGCKYSLYRLAVPKQSPFGAREWIHIAVLPPFKITSAEQLLNKIKTIATFS